jgi:hypothetical protein
VAGFCEYGDEPAGSGSAELVSLTGKQKIFICIAAGIP